MENVKEQLNKVKSEMAKVIVGQDEVIDGVLISLLVGGHILLEGPPGVAKTLIAKALARSFSGEYKRIQFTPDLMPLDVIGTNIFDFQKQTFLFKKGPLFTDILLADEINRTPPKTQAALLEAMEEKQVTVDGTLYSLSPVFTVIATQNPLEYEGTYPLPEAQLDRFLMKLQIAYPESETETAIYKRYQHSLVGEDDLGQIRPVMALAEIIQLRSEVANVQVRDELFGYIQQVIKATRESPFLSLGASPRAGIYLLHVAKAYAAFQGRDYVIPDDIQEMAYPVLRHRLLVKPEAQIDGRNVELIIKNILSGIKIPR